MFDTLREMVTKISKAGFEVDGLEEVLSGLLAGDVGVLNLEVPVGDQWQRLTADLDIYRENEKYLTWLYYNIHSPRQGGGLEHFVNNGIDSRDLEQRLARLDWSSGLEGQHWAVVDGIGEFAKGYADRDEAYQRMVLDVTGGLLSKYVGGHNAENQVLDRFPSYRDLFYQRHFFWSEVPLSYALKKIYEPRQVLWPVSKTINMNINKTNLENLQAEMRALKFDERLIEAMESEMAKGRPLFDLRAQVQIERGQMDLTLRFKQSGSSEYYYLNRYELSMTSAKPLEADKKYWVIADGKNEKDQTPTKSFVNVVEAIEYFKNTPGVKELAIGKTAADKFTLATRDKVKVDYVEKDFKMAYYGTIRTNTFYVERGKGINFEQGVNLMLGRAVYRDDLVNRGTGESYKAWNTFEFNEAKDKYGNFKVKQYGENYGVDVIKELASYNIKELADPKKEADIISQLKDGHRPVVTVKNVDGVEQQMRIEAMPRYGNYNFYKMDGKMEKREQFQKEPIFAQAKGKEKGQDKKADKQQGMSV